jgi:hypothetical protein
LPVGCRYASTVLAHVLQRLMRHANINTTMDYYVNIDAAVEEAVLGPQRKTSRNNGQGAAPVLGSAVDASAFEEVRTGDASF